MTDIRVHAAALVERRAMRQTLLNRPDIEKLSKYTVDLLTGKAVSVSSETFVKKQLTMLPTAAALADLLSATEFDVTKGGIALKLPAGTRHEFLQFSPVLQIARYTSVDGRVSGRLIEKLPITNDEIYAHLHRIIGLPEFKIDPHVDPVRAPSSCERYLDLREREPIYEADFHDVMRRRFNFDLRQYSAFLHELMTQDATLYLMIISREYLLALQFAPWLANKPNKHPSDKLLKLLPDFNRPAIQLAMSVGELARARDLAEFMMRFSASAGTQSVRDLAATVDGLNSQNLNRVAKEIRVASGVGQIIDDSHIQTTGVKQLRGVSSIRAEFAPAHIYPHLESGSFAWDNPVAALDRGTARSIVDAPQLAVIYADRTKGKGVSTFDDSLEVFYGVDAFILPYLAVYEIGFAITTQTAGEETECIATLIIETLAGYDPRKAVSTMRLSPETRRKAAVKAYKDYLPLYPRFGSAGRFVSAMWLTRQRDNKLYELLLSPRLKNIGSRQTFVEKFSPSHVQLANQFPKLFQNHSLRGLSVDIVCELAIAQTTLPRDPIFINFLRKGGKLKKLNFGIAPHLTTSTKSKSVTNFRKKINQDKPWLMIARAVEKVIGKAYQGSAQWRGTDVKT